jgi:hypothetical protein
VAAAGQEATQTIAVQEDPRITLTPAERTARRQALDRLLPLAGPTVTAQRTITALRSTLAGQIEAWKRPGAPTVPDAVAKMAADLLAKIDEVYPNYGTPPSEERGLGDAGPPLVDRGPTLVQRLLGLYNQIANYSAPPTAWQLEQIDILTKRATEVNGRVRQLVETDLAALNKAMTEAGIPHIAVRQPQQP